MRNALSGIGIALLLVTASCGHNGTAGSETSTYSTQRATQVLAAQTSETPPMAVPSVATSTSRVVWPPGSELESGSLWVRPSPDAGEYMVIQLNGLGIGTVASPACAEILPGDIVAVCRDDAGGILLWDFVTGERSTVTSEAVDWYAVSASASWILLGRYANEAAEAITILSLPVGADSVSRTGIVLPLRSSRLMVPSLSSDAEYIGLVAVGAQGPQAYVWAAATGETLPVRYSNPATHDLSWSPVAPLFLMGATDVVSELPPSPHELVLVDARTREARLLAHAPDGQSYSSFWERAVWSPDGSRIVATQGPNVCVFSVDTMDGECQRVVDELSGIRAVAWSPSGQHIALVEGHPGSARCNIVVYAPGGAATTIWRNLELAEPYIFWRDGT